MRKLHKPNLYNIRVQHFIISLPLLNFYSLGHINPDTPFKTPGLISGKLGKHYYLERSYQHPNCQDLWPDKSR